MLRQVVAVVTVGIALAGCSWRSITVHPSPPKPVPASALDELLLNARDVTAIMGGDAMTAQPAVSLMGDHRDLMPNLNCLGIWEIGERAIYGHSGLTGARRQTLREPNSDTWNSQVVQGVATFPSIAAARDFFSQSKDRWSKCTNHRVNMTVNNKPLMSLTFGSLTKTDNELTIPVSRTGDASHPCQRALAVDNNVIIDVAACGPKITNQASSIVDKIKSQVAVAG